MAQPFWRSFLEQQIARVVVNLELEGRDPDTSQARPE
ncbi:UNVERIFIED_ORG: hypothetical protein J2W85_004681 [Ensifer adhaerens]|nr:hypothetical protein [Ensifer adhaerens]